MKNSGIKNTNTSGVTGVCFNKFRNKWLSQITVGKKYIYLGTYTEFDDAVKARWDAEVLYEFPNCNTDSTAYNYLVLNNLIK